MKSIYRLINGTLIVRLTRGGKFQLEVDELITSDSQIYKLTLKRRLASTLFKKYDLELKTCRGFLGRKS